MRRLRPVLWTIAATAFCGSGSMALSDPLKIAYAIWAGYGPIFVAQEKGFFAKEGVEVEMINIEDSDASLAALADGEVDAVLDTLDALVRESRALEHRYVAVLALDESLGADGIVANKDIQAIADLRGKVVGLNASGTVSEFYVNVLLREAGLSQGDIEIVDLTAEDAGNAFLVGDVDAAVTWEPWLTMAKQANHGHLLADSADQPGLIVDVLATTARTADEREAELKAFARAWFQAIDYVTDHPDEANWIMAEGVGGWLDDPTVFAELSAGFRYYDEQRNRLYFGTSAQPGPIYETLQMAIEVWSDLGVLAAQVSPADFVSHGILAE